MKNAVPCEYGAVTCISAWHNTVEHIHSPSNTFDDVRRRSNAHQVARLIDWHMQLDFINNVIHDLCRLSYCQSADCIAVQPQLCDFLHMRNTNCIVCSALVDAEQHLMRIDRSFQTVQTLHFFLTANQPASGSGTGIFHIIQRCRVFHAFIKRHGNGRAKIGLDLHTFFRSHEDGLAVNMRLKIYALFFDAPQLCQRKYLETAAVCQNRLVPVHKLV